MLKVIRRHILEAIFQVMRVGVSYHKGQKQLIKSALHLKSTLARPPIYNKTCPKKLSTASLGNPAGIKKPSLPLSFVQHDEKSLEG